MPGWTSRFIPTIGGRATALPCSTVSSSARAASAGTSVGIAGWDGDGTRAFAERHGFELGSVAVNRRQTLAEIDWADVERRLEEARPHAKDYELVRRTAETPDDELAALAEMTSAINDAPTDDLDIEDEVFTPDRVARLRDGAARPGRGRRVPPAVRPPSRHR